MEDNKIQWIQTTTKLTFKDTMGTWKARWGINRMNYQVSPGLYRIGEADSTSLVFVTANYKISFDRLRKELTGKSVWILVLDTKGINVWCSAGKGTFGTAELLKRLAITKLSEVIRHKNIVLPQLGAPGISAHEVQKKSGFKVIYGPVRASDIQEFLDLEMMTTPDMRKVKFTTYDRLVLTPIEFVLSIKFSLVVFGVLFILNSIGLSSFGVIDFYAYIGALVAGCIVVPVLLPWIPGKSFAFKGWLMGIFWTFGVHAINGWPNYLEYNWIRFVGYLLVLPAISSFYALNFTGASTYTSLSGVMKEMKIAMPAIIASGSLGAFILILNNFI